VAKRFVHNLQLLNLKFLPAGDGPQMKTNKLTPSILAAHSLTNDMIISDIFFISPMLFLSFTTNKRHIVITGVSLKTKV
jgi:hypothetical protein